MTHVIFLDCTACPALCDPRNLFVDVPAEAVLEIFGEFFYEFCVEYGYDRILRALGANPVEFLESLDALHDHLGSTYAGMDAPTFRCTTEDTEDSSYFYLHYYSHRPGLSPVVKGLVKAAIKGIFNIGIQLKVSETDGTELADETRFLVTLTADDEARHQRLGSSTSLNNNIHKTPLISKRTFAELFPFHLALDKNLSITQSGNGIQRLLPGNKAFERNQH